MGRELAGQGREPESHQYHAKPESTERTHWTNHFSRVGSFLLFTGQLGPEYSGAYKCYLGVLAGELPLADLGQPLQTLRHFLVGSVGMAKLSKDHDLSGLLPSVEVLGWEAIGGVDQCNR